MFPNRLTTRSLKLLDPTSPHAPAPACAPLEAPGFNNENHCIRLESSCVECVSNVFRWGKGASLWNSCGRIHELDRVIGKSLRSFYEDIRAAEWYGHSVLLASA